MAVDPFSAQAAARFLSGSSVAAKWPTVGHVVEGTVTDFRMAQQRHYDLNENLFWVGKTMVPESQTQDHSNPVMQLVMGVKGKPTGETWEGLNNRRKALPDDDGQRTAYVKAKLAAAVAKGIKDSGGQLEEGAYIRIERTTDVPNQDKKKQDAHNYKVTWTPAASNTEAAGDFLAGAEADDENPFGKDAPF